MLPLLLALSLPSHGYETDQFSARRAPPVDGNAMASLGVDAMLTSALERVSHERGLCSLDDRRLRERLAREIYDLASENVRIPARGRMPAMGMGAYAAWMEEGPIPRWSPTDEADVYAEVRWVEAPALAMSGPCSTVRLGDVLLGTDKIEHFWEQGYMYYRRSEDGRDPDAAIAWGTMTEWRWWGASTTRVFSWGDLAANYEGYRFYAGLLKEGSPIQRDEQGCPELVESWDWRRWVDWQWDEVENPPSLLLGVDDRVHRAIAERRGPTCDAWRAGALEGLARRPAEGLPAAPTSTRGEVPPRDDPYRLDLVCAEDATFVADGAGLDRRRRAR